MPMTASKLRQDIYRILDSVIETGEPVEIERNGALLRIVLNKHAFKKLDKLKKRSLTDEDSDNFTHLDWTSEWKI
ncbi:MAG: hypothetical protein QNK11_00520 [Legionella sp.]|nr:hypothetical protein [Legionella sp.]